MRSITIPGATGTPLRILAYPFNTHTRGAFLRFLRIWYAGSPVSENTPYRKLAEQTRSAPVLTPKHRTGCIRVFENTASRRVGEQGAGWLWCVPELVNATRFRDVDKETSFDTAHEGVSAYNTERCSRYHKRTRLLKKSLSEIAIAQTRPKTPKNQSKTLQILIRLFPESRLRGIG